MHTPQISVTIAFTLMKVSHKWQRINMVAVMHNHNIHSQNGGAAIWVDTERGEGDSESRPPPPPLPGKSQVAIGFLRNSGTDIPRDAIGPMPLEGGQYGCL